MSWLLQKNNLEWLLQKKQSRVALTEKQSRVALTHGLQSRPPSPKRAERKVRRRPFREAGSGQNNGTR